MNSCGKKIVRRPWNAQALGLPQEPEETSSSTSNYQSYSWNKKTRRNTWNESSQYNYYDEREYEREYAPPKPWRSNSYNSYRETREDERNFDDDENAYLFPSEKTDERCVNVTNPNKSDLPKVITVKISQLSLNDSASDKSDDVITPKTPEQNPIDDSPLLINLDEPPIVPKPVENKISEDIYSLDWEQYQYSIFENELRASKQNAPQPIRCKLPESLADFDSLI
ncbi:5712_t:CDS:2 [Dentiscutata erythropus]|uniref:5712_t:CDS:1 n=1 Tax=Dentiscutata erythropus TaxID=1348616 RepID=A0A9N9C928_9GLOM|nr:5712_t:CDS:2 [Dentiscutata erythropus]